MNQPDAGRASNVMGSPSALVLGISRSAYECHITRYGCVVHIYDVPMLQHKHLRVTLHLVGLPLRIDHERPPPGIEDDDAVVHAEAVCW